jgi:hypothetical protein
MQIHKLQSAAWTRSREIRRTRRLYRATDDLSDPKLFLAMKEATKAGVLGLAESQEDFWSPEATAKRILDCAKRLAGGDPSKIELLRNAVIQGFQEAERILGGLPEVCRETYRIVMEGFDAWEREYGLDPLV